MYDDPKDIRDRPVTVRFREETYEMIKAPARVTPADRRPRARSSSNAVQLQPTTRGAIIMSKGADIKKETKKKPAKTSASKKAAPKQPGQTKPNQPAAKRPRAE